jgi:FtsH-binding integral membrane protein
MADNPYHSPSCDASLDEKAQHEHTCRAAVAFVETVRFSAWLLIVSGLCAAGLPVTLIVESLIHRQPIDPALFVTLWCLPLALVVWGILQRLLNTLTITFTGVAAFSAILLSATLIVNLIRAGAERGPVITACIGTLVLSFFMLAPIITAVDVWVWRFRGLDPGAIARDYQRAQLAAFLSQCAGGATHAQ